MNKMRLIAISVLMAAAFSGYCYNAPLDSIIPSELIQIYTKKHKGTKYQIVQMSRKNNLIKTYYMPNEGNFENLTARYLDFKETHPNIVAFTSGGFMIGTGLGLYLPEGLTIDNGQIINERMADFDGLVISFPSGAMAVYDLDEDNIKTDIGNFKIRSNPRDLFAFKNWAKTNSVTIFQTFLLAYDNVLQIDAAGCLKCDKMPTRFLIVSKDKSGEIFHYIVERDRESSETLFQSASDVFDLFQKEGISVDRMINLETGMHNAFSFEKASIAAPKDHLLNLLVYYYE
jgi:hypothetical protein